MSAKPRIAALARLALLCAVVVGLVFGAALAASPQFHAWLHHDGDHPEHVCLATTLQTGGIEEVLVVVMAVEPMAEPVTTSAPHAIAEADSFFLSCRVLEHAPPAVS